METSADVRSAYRSLRQLHLFRSAPARALRALAQYCTVSLFRADQTVLVEGEPDRALWILAQGKLLALRGNEIQGEIAAGESFAERSLVRGGLSDTTVRCAEDSTLIRLDRSAFETVLRQEPALKAAALSISARTHLAINRFRPDDQALKDFLRTIDLFARMPEHLLVRLTSLMQWLMIPDHEDVVRQGEPGDSLYVLLNGRMRWVQRDGELRIVQSGFLYPGDVFGEMSIITGENRSASVYALRDCEVLRLEGRRFERMMQREPGLLYPLSRTLARRLSERTLQTTRPPRSFCVLPLHGFNAGRFSQMLAASIPGAVILTSADLPSGAEVEGSIEDASFSTRIAEMERSGDCTILEADTGDTAWTRRAIRLADQILLVADPGFDPALSSIELKYIQNFSSENAQRAALVFVSDRIVKARAAFLDRRPMACYHVRPSNVADCSRLARIVTGRSIGLVLGGGGARGLAHIGVYRALTESGVPVDSVGGTSMGAILGGAIAQQMSADDVLRLALGIVQRGNPIGDYVLPIVSMIKGRRFTRAIQEAFGDLLIEDLPVPYFAAASDLTLEQRVIIDRGPLWRAARASSSLPGIAPPMIEGGHLLVDGGILSNVPADIMRERGAGQILAVHIEGTETTAYDSGLAKLTSHPGEAPDLTRILANRAAPQAKRIEYPGLPMLLLRCALLGAKAQEKSSRAAATVWATLPVTEYGLLDWSAADRFVEIGYRHAMENMALWREKLQAP